MPLYRPSELREWLKEQGISPKKGLSQNFLIDGHITRKIIDWVEPSNWALAIEIGPGPGVLTEALLAQQAPLLAIETDQRLASLLPRLGPVEVLPQDALKIEWPELLKSRLVPGARAVIVSNLPYHLSTQLLRKLLPLGQWIGRLVLMVQKEFFQRLIARPGPQPYGPLSILTEHYAAQISQFDVAPTCFFPRPSVQSSVVKIELKGQQEALSKRFEAFVEELFEQRRKTIGSILHRKSSIELRSPWAQYRAEQLSYTELLAIFNEVSSELGK